MNIYVFQAFKNRGGGGTIPPEKFEGGGGTITPVPPVPPGRPPGIAAYAFMTHLITMKENRFTSNDK